MGTVARIYREIIETPESNGGRQVITLVQMVEDITDSKLINLLQEKCDEGWNVSSECGYIGELEGVDLLDILLSSSDVCTDNMEEDDIFRVEISY